MRRLMTAGILLGMIAILLTALPTRQTGASLLQAGTIVSPPVHPYIVSANTPLTGTATFQNNGFIPQQIRGAYGVSSTFQGKGITIAIIDAYYHPTAAHDFDVFSRQFGLPTIAGGC